MTIATRPTGVGSRAGLAATLLAALPGLLCLCLLCLATPAAAQGFGWFGNLFGGFPRPNQGAPAYPGYGSDGYAPRQPADQYYARPRRHVVRRPAEPVQREAAKPPKNATLFVDVFGDSLGQMLGQGLDEALADRPDVAVVQKARASSGLVGTDGYDWQKAIAELLSRTAEKPGAKAGEKGVEKAGEGRTFQAKSFGGKIVDGRTVERPAPSTATPAREKIDVAVMMIGINDQKPITVDGRVLQPGTAEWTSAYAKRVMAIDEMFRARGVPLIWVGVPITKDDAFADAMAGLNDITREAAAKTGATYVDTWEAFSDDNGNFAAYGPDVNGQTVRLRAADGISFTKAGARKLAHFVEAQVRRALEGKAPQPLLPTESPAAKEKPQLVAIHPDVGPIRNLNEPPVAANGMLAGLDPRLPGAGRGDGKAEAQPPAPAPPAAASAALAPAGETPRPASAAAPTASDAIPPGRADDSRWPADARSEP